MEIPIERTEEADREDEQYCIAHHDDIQLEIHLADGTVTTSSQPSWYFASRVAEHAMEKGHVITRGDKVYHYPPHRISLIVYYAREQEGG